MNIRHQYNSASPYESCGYERCPAYPAEGQTVTIKARLEDAQGVRRCWLRWRLNGAEQPAFTMEFVGRDIEGRLFFSAVLPAQPALAFVEYAIQADNGPLTPWFEYAVLAKVVLQEPAAIEQNKTSAALYFKTPQGVFCWRWALKQETLCHQLEKTTALPCENRQTASLEWSGYRLELRSTAPYVRLAKAGGDILLQIENPLYLLVNGQGEPWQVKISVALAGVRLYGTGERYTGADQAGRSLIFSSYEQFTFQGQRSYLPIPLFYTEHGVGLLHSGSCELALESRPLPGKALGLLFTCECSAAAPRLEQQVLLGPPAEILRQYQAATGPALLPPVWAFGPWMSSNRWENACQVEQQLKKMKEHDIPATVLVLERWSDDTTFDIFEDAAHTVQPGEHCFTPAELDFSGQSRWPAPKALCEKIKEMGLRLILWQAPILRLPPTGRYPQAEADREYAIRKRYCVMMPDGQPYLCPEQWFKGSLLVDFTNPDAVDWWLAKRAYLIKEYGAQGFKTDSGELVVDDRAVFANGKTGREMRNVYPLYYEAAYRRLLEDQRVEGVNFTRAGYSGAQQYALHWTGDQRSCFAEYKAQLSACLSAGLSGVLFMGFDLAGFAGPLPTAELYCRGVSFAAFSTLMQFHSEPATGSNNDRSPWNMAEQLHAPWLIGVYGYYAKLRMALLPYLQEEAGFCAQNARPLMAHLVVDWPDDAEAQACDTEYMLGRALLVAPVLEEGALGRRIYLPEGGWMDAFTGREQAPGWHWLPCAPERIPVFVKTGASLCMEAGRTRIKAMPGRPLFRGLKL